MAAHAVHTESNIVTNKVCLKKCEEIAMNRSLPDAPGQENDGVAANALCSVAPLQSGVLSSPADSMLSKAIANTLRAPAAKRARLFMDLVREIEQFMATHPEERPWTCAIYNGTDHSMIFRGGGGHSLVIDATGRLWRARSYEDFDTTYRFTDRSCEIDNLTPLYAQMREYVLDNARGVT
jgi:hypothetical protein